MEGLGATVGQFGAQFRVDTGDGHHEVPNLLFHLSDAFTAIEMRLERLSVRIEFER